MLKRSTTKLQNGNLHVEIHQPVLLPSLETAITSVPNQNLTPNLEDNRMDELHEIHTQVIHNQPRLSLDRISHIPSACYHYFIWSNPDRPSVFWFLKNNAKYQEDYHNQSRDTTVLRSSNPSLI